MFFSVGLIGYEVMDKTVNEKKLNLKYQKEA